MSSVSRVSRVSRVSSVISVSRVSRWVASRIYKSINDKVLKVGSNEL
jgi:hypothetical protein